MNACPDRQTAIQSYADGELDAVSAAALEDHLRICPGCAAALDEVMAVREALGAPLFRYEAPMALRARIERLTGLVTAQPPGTAPRRAFAPWAGGGMIGAVAASLILLVGMPAVTSTALQDDLVESHVRSLEVSHLVDVPTSDRHVVKPWFNGRLDFSPPVPDLAAQGFPLVGGRLDYVDGHRVAALVYRRRLHTINLFVRPASATTSPVATTSRRQSYNLARWVFGGLEYWAVSDVAMDDVVAFRRAFQAKLAS